MSAKVPFSKIARRIAYFILFLTFVTFIYYQTRVIIMESSALGFGRSYEGKELLGSVLHACDTFPEQITQIVLKR